MTAQSGDPKAGRISEPNPPDPRVVADPADLAATAAWLAAARDPALGAFVVVPELDGPPWPVEEPARALVLARPRERAPVGEPTVFWFDLGAIGDLAPLRRLLVGPEAPYVVFHRAQQAVRSLSALDLVPSRIGSAEAAASLLSEGDPEKRHEALDDLARAVLGRELPTLLPVRAREAIEAEAAMSIMRELTARLRTSNLVRSYELECALLPAVAAMELTGAAVDTAAFQRVVDGWVRERRATTDADRLVRLDKLVSTYGHWPRECVALDGRIRYRLHPLAADSGRFSCTSPNLQQVPAEHTAPGLRACFVPAPGHRFVIADYAQIELRVAAHMAPCDALRGVFHDGRDPHRATAATITGRAESTISDRERQLAKAVNFGFLFGMGPRRFQEYAEKSYGVVLDLPAATAAREAFFATFPGIAAWHRRIGELGRRGDREDLVVHTVLGRRKRFRAGKFSFSAALNIPVQGTAAEGFKLAMIRLHRELAAIGGRGVLCVHDEYVAEVPAEAADRAQALIRTAMTEAMATVVGTVPIVVETEIADSWAGS